MQTTCLIPRGIYRETHPTLSEMREREAQARTALGDPTKVGAGVEPWSPHAVLGEMANGTNTLGHWYFLS